MQNNSHLNTEMSCCNSAKDAISQSTIIMFLVSFLFLDRTDNWTESRDSQADDLLGCFIVHVYDLQWCYRAMGNSVRGRRASVRCGNSTIRLQ